VECPDCGGNVRVKTFFCPIHAHCTLVKPIPHHQICHICADYRRPVDRPEAGQRRHLLFHLYPYRDGERWRWHLGEIARRLRLFNGRKAIAVATDENSVPAEQVRPLLGGWDEIIEIRNDPALREVATFEPLFGRVAEYTEAGDVTLYAHAKGTVRYLAEPIQRWTNVLYETLLDHWPAVQDVLRAYPLAGSFRRDMHGWNAHESLSPWHYSGSWFWFRNRELFGKQDWRRIDRFWSGVEPYPSLHFARDEAGLVFHRWGRPDAAGESLYHADYWDRVIHPALVAWRVKHERDRTDWANLTTAAAPRPATGLKLNLGCGPHRVQGWLNADVFESATVRPDEILERDELWPWAAGTFNAAYLGHMLEHQPWEMVPGLLAQVRRVVAPGGWVCVVCPDFLRAAERYRRSPSDATMLHLREVAEDRRHYQKDAPPEPWPEGRHYWNAYEERIVLALIEAGFAEVRPMPFEPWALEGWPVTDFIGAQCAALGKVP
jgi:hypothetical protein